MTDAASNQPVITTATLLVDVQQALDEQDYAESEEPPSQALLTEWANAAYRFLDDESFRKTNEITIRLVEVEEMTILNRDYRQQDKPTNVLSFACEPLPFFACENEVVGESEVVSQNTVMGDSTEGMTGSDELELEYALLGDIVICHPVIVNEAAAQNKTTRDHYAHMVTHGVLHLCGYDHQNEEEAEQMESLETTILAKSGIANPYNAALTAHD